MSHLIRYSVEAALAALMITASLPAQQSKRSTEPATVLATLAATGPDAALAIYPVRVLGRPDRMVRDALGLVLEHHGMTCLEAQEEAFEPANGGDWADVAAQFTGFLQHTPPKATYALYAEYLGDPRTGPTEVRWLLAERSGTVLISDRQTRKDPDFKRTAARDPDPLGCSTLVVKRVFSQVGWREKPTATGPFTRRWAEASGVPGEPEQAAITKRLEHLRGDIATTSLEIHATRIGKTQDAASAARLVQSVAQRLGCTTLAALSSATVDIAPTPNQQKHLWSLARGFRDFVRAHPPKAEYAVLVDVLGDLAAGRIAGVQVVVCDKTGEWVLVDFQNDQHPDFQRIKPRTTEDCERLAVDRLAARLK